MIKKADTKEVDDLLSIYIEKVKWLRATNKPLWDESQFTLDEIHKKYDNPVFYVCCDDKGVLFGGFILVENDQIYWPEKAHDSAYYFHKFVIHNDYCGKGHSDRIMDWVKLYGKEMSKKYVRLDYDGNRKPIADLYTRNGFVPVDIISNLHVSKLVKAEYIIS